MNYILETQRLSLREFNLNDTNFIIQLLNSPGWIQFIGDKNVRTHQQALNYLENGPFQSYRQYGFGLYLVEKKADKTAIGMCGILKRDNLKNPDIGFAVLPEFQGKGYAFEITNATLLHAQHKWNISKIWAISLADNIKSIRLLEKLGLRCIDTYRFPGSEKEIIVFSI